MFDCQRWKRESWDENCARCADEWCQRAGVDVETLGIEFVCYREYGQEGIVFGNGEEFDGLGGGIGVD